MFFPLLNWPLILKLQNQYVKRAVFLTRHSYFWSRKFQNLSKIHGAKKNIRRIFKLKWVLKKAGIREMKFHTTRHTYASLLLSAGVSPVYVKEQLGHSSIGITVDCYGQWIRNNENKSLVNKLDSFQNPTPFGTPEAPKNKTAHNSHGITSRYIWMVPKARLELARCCHHKVLNLACLPIPPLRHTCISVAFLL